MSYPVTSIKYNKHYKNLLAVAYEDGILDMYKLSEDLYENKHDEIEKLNKIVSSLLA